MACSKSSLDSGCQSTVTGRVSKASLESHLKGSNLLLRDFFREQVLFRENNDGVVEYTMATICDEHLAKGGCREEKCQRLHICPYFAVGGDCGQHKDNACCQFGHNFQTHHNIKCSPNIARAESSRLLQFAYENCRQQNTLPGICVFYNQAKGCTNKRCRFLHVCKPYINQSCKFGKKCKRSHNIYDDQPNAILKKYNIDTDRSPKETLLELRRLFGVDLETEAKTDTAGHVPTSRQISFAADGDLEICSFFLNGKCSFGVSCRNLHDKTKYRWQYKESMSSEDWTSFNDGNNDSLESAFREPQCNGQRATLSNGILANVDFVTMTVTGGSVNSSPVRRLSTMSVVKAPPSKVKVATTWRWYWKDVNGKFVMYGQKGNTDASQTSSDDIEEKFLADSTSEIDFQTGEHRYKLNFATMKQRNINYSTEREVRRRPIYVQTSDVDNLRFQTLSTKSSFPGHWALTESDGDFKRVQIAPSGKTEQEYKQVEQIFLQTMSSHKVTKIERIQNQDLWEKYTLKKIQMQKKGDVNEKQLFHGTSSSVIDGICEQGFDWRLTGSRTGTLFGQGSYFHREASYSHSYCSDCKAMFLAKVLVGRYTKGASSMRRPPPIDPSDPNKLYDAVVDDVSNPKIHVVFSQEQTYPEFIITYN